MLRASRESNSQSKCQDCYEKYGVSEVCLPLRVWRSGLTSVERHCEFLRVYEEQEQWKRDEVGHYPENNYDALVTSCMCVRMGFLLCAAATPTKR